MKKYLLFFILIYFILLLLPLAASAIEYPFGTLGANPTPCEYMKTVFVWGLGIVGAVAVVAIAYGGFRYMVGNVQTGKEYIYSALLGLLLLLASWLILYTINPDLATMNCNLPSSGPAAGPAAGPAGPAGPGPAVAPSSLTDQSVRDKLSADSGGKITENKTCQNAATCVANPPGQTCVSGLQNSTIQGAEKLQKDCNTSTVITGGTECGHASGTYSHSNGYKLDYGFGSNNATLNSCIYSKIGTTNPKAFQEYKPGDGNTYTYETGPPHWDVCFGC